MRSSVLFVTLLLLLGSQALAEDGFVDGFDLPAGASYVGSETCLDCHDEIGTAYTHTAHAVEMSPTVPGSQATACEACHGPGSLHVAEIGRASCRERV